MAEHKTEIRFCTPVRDGGETAITVWHDLERPQFQDLVTLRWPTPEGDEGWICRCAEAAITFERDVQIFTVCVSKETKLTTRKGGE